jgi:hypothetical protein
MSKRKDAIEDATHICIDDPFSHTHRKDPDCAISISTERGYAIIKKTTEKRRPSMRFIVFGECPKAARSLCAQAKPLNQSA